MKTFVIAMLAMGTALLLAALFWPDRPQPASQRRPHLLPIAASVDASDVEQPPQSSSPAKPAAVTSYLEPANEVPAPNPPPKPSALPPTPDQATDFHLTADEQLTFKQTGTDDTSLRNADFPRTYIRRIHVDLTSPNHWVTLTWSGPQARLQVNTRYHSSPGRGLGNNNCDDPAESCRVNSNCTPKGTMHVQAFSNSMQGSPEVRFVTWFDTKRAIALHYYPFVPNYPASHGCVRLNEYAARLIHNNSKIGETEVIIDGKWTFSR